VPAHEAVVNAPAHDPEKPVAQPHSNAFGVPLPVHPEAHHEQTQQEDYLWGV
jgi:hypothetical protein